ncbi:uncharacterized protein [Argopecten irradians]
MPTFPCGPRQLQYNPFKQFCRPDGRVRACDPSSCLMELLEWERQACSLFCKDDNGVGVPIAEDGTMVYWRTATYFLIAIVVVLVVVLVGVCYRYYQRSTSLSHRPKPTAPPPEDDPDETKVLMEKESSVRSSLDSGAVTLDLSDTSRSTDKYSMVPPQNNHEDPHPSREGRAAVAISTKNEEVRRPDSEQDPEHSVTNTKEC